jgi:uncharacterized protein with von Willebrand factor type A (vWA) domain
MSESLVRLVDEFLWRLRREGFEISTAQAIDATRAVATVGLAQRQGVKTAIAAVVVQHAKERPRYDAVFDAFFDPFLDPGASDAGATLWDRLAAEGFDDAELEALREGLGWLAAGGGGGAGSLGVLLDRGADFDRLLAMAGVARTLDAHSGMQLGFRTHQLLARIGAGRARLALAALRARLARALGARGEALADALARELDRTDDRVRAYVRAVYDRLVAEAEGARRSRRPGTTPFAALSEAEIEEVRQAVRRFADRLRGAARVRARHARRGRIDAHATLRRAQRTGGVPFVIARKRRPRDRPKLVLLCDVSDSVRAAAAFLLEFTYAAQDLFERARSFVFVSELGESTQLFARMPVRAAIARAWAGGVVPASDNSNYGRVLRSFAANVLPDVDRRTTVVVLGDGRTNFHDAAPEILDRIRERARALLWLCPEPRGKWGEGDSAMPHYAPKCTAVFEVQSAADLERAGRALVAR